MSLTISQTIASRLLLASICTAGLGCAERSLTAGTPGNDIVQGAGAGGTISGAGGAISGAGGWTAGGPGGGAGAIATPGCSTISTVPGQLDPCGRTNALAYSPDGTILAMGTEAPAPNVHLWRLSDGGHLRDVQGIGTSTYSVAFSPDGLSLAVAGENQNDPSTIVTLYEVASGAVIRNIPATCGSYASTAAFSPDGTLLATAGYMGVIEVWRVADGVRVTSIPYTSSIEHAHFSPDGSRLIAGGYDGFATVWSIPDGAQLLTLTGVASEQADAAFSPDGSQIASNGDDNVIKIWDATSGAILQTLAGHSAYISHVVWINQDRIVSNDWSGAILSWSRGVAGAFAASGGWMTGSQSLGIAVSPDRSTLVAGGGSPQQGFEFLSL